MSVAQGDRIMVKKPGSSNYVNAKVLDIVKGDYKVIYDNGKEQVVTEKNIKMSNKSPSRGSGRSNSKSPRRSSRTKSPARRKSPVRNKSVERKSPSRGRKLIKNESSPEIPTRITRSPGRKTRIAMVAPSQIEEKIEKKSYQPIDYEKELKELKDIRSATLRETRLTSKTTGPITFASITQRKSTRITTSTPKIDNLSEKKISAVYKEEKTEEEITPQYKVVEYLNKPMSPIKGGIYPVKSKQSGGWFGALIFTSIYFVYSLIANLYYSQKITKWHWKAFPLSLKTYFTLEGLYLTLGFVFVQTLLLVLPIGKLIQSNKTLSYKFRKNGLLSAILTIGVVLTLHYYYKLPTAWVLDHIIPMMLVASVLSVILAIILYVKGAKAQGAHVNAYGNSGSFLNDFVLGREIAPKVGIIDIRILLLRISFNAILLLSTLIVINNKKLKNDFWLDSSFISLCMIGIYCLYIFAVEDHTVSTFEYTKEGTGLLIFGYFIYPFFVIPITRSLVLTGYNIPWYCLLGMIVLYLVGFIIMCLSNLEKARFRLNPNDSRIYHLKTLPTMSGKKLLVSGWWGWSRHPNYLGDILINCSMCSLVGLTDYLPYVIPLLTIITLVLRVFRDDQYCRRAYGVAWDHYCSRVKHRFVKGLF